MEETKEQQSLYRLLQLAIYFSVLLEFLLFVIGPKIPLTERGMSQGLHRLFGSISALVMYHDLLNSKLFTMLLLFLVAFGTLAKKDKDLDPKKQIALPLASGLLLIFGSLAIYVLPAKNVLFGLSASEIGYMASSLIGTILTHIAMDNASKIISSKLGKDKWNEESESFMQNTRQKENPYSVNIPMLFYYRKKVRSGYLSIENVFRSTLLIGTPGSGKSFGIILPYIRQLTAKSFCLCIFDFKYPDLAEVAYYHHLLARSKEKEHRHRFHVINLNEVEKSRRINPLRREYITSLADASETAEALVEALKKGDKSGGSDQFFTQSAVNFLSACIYFFSRYQGGRYSTLPHVLAFLNRSYDEIFSTLFSEPELTSLLSPFASAYQAKAFEQLEGQVGTLKVFISRLATKETFWVFSSDDFNLKISDPDNPSTLILASDPSTQSINSACYSVVLNRLTRLLNSKGNLPSGIIVDEAPTLFIFKVENLISTARSNKVALILGLQEIPQLEQQYGKDTAKTITSVVGNIISGSVRNKESLEWLERLFGKVKQGGESLSIDRTKTSLSISERLEPLIPAGKIASLRTGEVVGLLANDAGEFDGKFETSAVRCRINLDMKELEKEEQQYLQPPPYYDFGGRKDQVLKDNFHKINMEILYIVSNFMPKPASTPTNKPKGAMRPTPQKTK
ncbi:MAG: type IV secretion system DNA-binding domain-containing protein [Pseudosphingobacterium sp.]|nr:type IV secretion system DNA-binding domain-containing protein [Pseudosphingobacterium sp.]